MTIMIMLIRIMIIIEILILPKTIAVITLLMTPIAIVIGMISEAVEKIITAYII